MKGLFLLGLLILIAAVFGLFLGIGQNTDVVELARVVKSQTALDQLQEIRHTEQPRSPLPMMGITALVILAVLSLSKITEIRKIMGYWRQMLRGRKVSGPTRRPSGYPQHPGYPPMYPPPQPPQLPGRSQMQLPEHTGTDDF